MTRPPCIVDGTACPRRAVGCRRTCEAWQKWVQVHAEEKAEIDRKKHADGLADGFLAEAYKRDEQHRRREQAKRRQT